MIILIYGYKAFKDIKEDVSHSIKRIIHQHKNLHTNKP